MPAVSRNLNQASGACLFAFIGAQRGAPMGLNTCRTVSNEQFDTYTSLPSNFTVRESKIGLRDTGFCVENPGGAGVQLVLFECDGARQERWEVQL